MQRICAARWRWLTSVLASLLLVVGHAQAAEPIRITDGEASAHVGEPAIVEGKVAAVFTSSKGNTFLNFGAAYPNHRFSGVVFARFADAFRELHALEGKRVQITGTITLYRGRPQIILESPAQLKVLK